MKTVAKTRQAVENVGRRRRLRTMIPIDAAAAAALFLVEHCRLRSGSSLGDCLSLTAGELTKVR